MVVFPRPPLTLGRMKPTPLAPPEDAIEILLPVPMDHGFDYALPQGFPIPRPGTLVRVPFGRREAIGIVVGPARGDVAPEKRKYVLGLAGDARLASLPEALMQLLDWVAWYTLSPRGLVAKMAIPPAEALQAQISAPRYRLSATAPALLARSAPRQRVAALLTDGTARTAQSIAADAEVTTAVVRAMREAGGLEEVPESLLNIPSPSRGKGFMHELPPLLGEQKEAADKIAAKLGQGFHTCLLDGVTGSGKTEVYFDTIARALRMGKQVLVLLPEIALSMAWVERFTARFGQEPAIWHSGISPARKRATWRGVRDGSVRLVVGARSSLFLPFTELGLIVVDEEHDSSYKQEDGVMYQARDMAVARARIEHAMTLLVSATPSMESQVNAVAGRYTPIRLHARYGTADLPSVDLVDMRQEKLPANQFLSQPLREALLGTLNAGHQALLFINRRGYAPLVLCRACGHRFACPNCDAWLVYHRARPRLQCHHCGHTEPAPHACPECKAEDSLVPYGPGVERVGEEVKQLVPTARIGLMTSDALASPRAIQALLDAMENRTIDVIVGTQMIAKGHHFPGLALVGVVDADMGLASSDFRACERTFQLLHQVAGRAGREAVRGQVLLQTFLPEHPVLQALASYDRDRFLAMEAHGRAEAHLPPYGRMAGLIVEGPDAAQVQKHAKALAAHAPQMDGFEVLGPAPAPLALLRGNHRMRLLARAERQISLQHLMPQWLNQSPAPPSKVRVKIDIDPYSFL